MKNFTRCRGTGVAAAALSLALVAPLVQPVAGAEDAKSEVTNVTATQGSTNATAIEAGKTLIIPVPQLAADANVTVSFETAIGKETVSATPVEENGKRVLKVLSPATRW